MLTLIEGLVYAGRFGLEVVTVFALIGGGLIKGVENEKLLFPILGVIVVLLWSVFVAPKASHFQGLFLKFLVERFCFRVDAMGFSFLFGRTLGNDLWCCCFD